MFRYILINKQQGRYILKHDPIGWDSNKYNFKRGSTYHGIMVEYSLELEFVKDGRDYLRACYEAEGVESIIDIIVEERDINLRWIEVYTGRISFARYSIRDDETTGIKANIEQTGFVRRFVNSDDIDINIMADKSILGEALPLISPRTITLHSKAISRRYEAKIGPDSPTDFESEVVGDSDARDSSIAIGFDNVVINEMEAFTYFTGFNTAGDKYEIFPTFEEKGPLEIQIRLKALVEIDWIQGQFRHVELQFYYQVNNEPPTVLFTHSHNKDGKDNYSRLVDFDFSITEDIKIGDKVYFWGRCLGEDTRGAYRWRFRIRPDKTVSFIKATALTQTEPTSAQGLLVHEVAARLVQSMTGAPNPLYSPLLGRTDSLPRSYDADGEASLLFLSHGFWVRNFPDSKPFTLTFKKFFESLSAIYNLGVGIEYRNGVETVIIEKHDYFYRDEVILELGRVSKLTKELVADRIYNQADIGFSKWETQSDGGLDEPNSFRAYSTPITQLKKKYAAISGFIAGGYLIEDTRRKQYKTGTTKDSSNDDDVYCICVLREGGSFVTERNQAFNLLENVISPDTIYNARITPARMLLNHAGNLKAGLLHQLGDYIRFTAGKGNYNMRSKLMSETKILHEGQDFLIAELPDPVIMPEMYSFTYALSAHEIKLIRENPHGVITFRDQYNNIKQGYIQELKASVLEPSEFKLLRKFE